MEDPAVVGLLALVAGLVFDFRRGRGGTEQHEAGNGRVEPAAGVGGLRRGKTDGLAQAGDGAVGVAVQRRHVHAVVRRVAGSRVVYLFHRDGLDDEPAFVGREVGLARAGKLLV